MYFVYLQSNTLLVYLMYRVSKKYEKIPQQIVLPKTGQFSSTNPNPKYSRSSSKLNIEVILAPKIRRSLYVILSTYLILGSWIMQLLTCQFFTIILYLSNSKIVLELHFTIYKHKSWPSACIMPNMRRLTNK